MAETENSQTVQERPHWQFQPGQSGNPGGKPGGVGEVRAEARKWTAEAIATLATIMKDTSASKPARVAAAEALLDRGWGKPQQTIDVGSSEWAALGAASLAALLASLPEAVRARYALMAAATGGEERQVIDITPPMATISSGEVPENTAKHPENAALDTSGRVDEVMTAATPVQMRSRWSKRGAKATRRKP